MCKDYKKNIRINYYFEDKVNTQNSLVLRDEPLRFGYTLPSRSCVMATYGLLLPVSGPYARPLVAI